MRRKIRGWDSNNYSEQVQVSKPNLVNFQLNGSILFLKWISSIGCVEGYKIYAGKNKQTLELIGETTNNNFTKQLTDNDYPYYVTVSAFYQSNESEKAQIIEIRGEIVTTIEFEQTNTNNVVSMPIQPQITQHSKPIENNPTLLSIKQGQVSKSFPFGLCLCCELKNPLMKLKGKIVCSKNTKNIYIQNGFTWVLQPQQIISDIQQIDQLLLQNSAYVGIGGVLVNRD